MDLMEEANPTIFIKIEEEISLIDSNVISLRQNSKMGSGGKMSECAMVLFRFVQVELEKKLMRKVKGVLELGSGTGAAGICVACLGMDVVCSDVSTVKRQLLDVNLQENREAVLENGGSLRAAEIDWLETEKVKEVFEANRLGGVQLILLSDVVLNSGSLISLPKYLHQLCELFELKPMILMAYRQRTEEPITQYILDGFLKYKFEGEVITADQLHPHYRHQGVTIIRFMFNDAIDVDQ